MAKLRTCWDSWAPGIEQPMTHCNPWIEDEWGWSEMNRSGLYRWLYNNYCTYPSFKLEIVGSTSSTRTRRGGSCLKDIYIYIHITFLIYRTCMRRAPAKPVRACTLRNWCLVFTCHIWSSTSHFTLDSLHTPHYTLHTALFTLHSSHCTLRSQHFTSHCTLKTPHFTLHTPHFTIYTSHCTLRTPNFTLHSPHFIVHTSHFSLLTASLTLQTSHFTLHTALFTPHTSHCTLHTPHFISSELFSPYPSSALLISSLLICHLSFHESLPSTTTKELACAVRQPGLCVRALCEAVAVLLSKNMTCARPRCNATSSKHFPHTSHCTLHTSHLSSSHLVSCLPICQLRSSWLFSCHLSAAQTFSCVGATFNLSRRFCTSARLSVTHLDSSACQKA